MIPMFRVLSSGVILDTFAPVLSLENYQR